MTRTLSRTVMAATVAAMLLALVAVGPVSAGSVSRDRAAERYAYELLNCTRTGGWVSKTGTCRAYGSGKYSVKRPALRLHRKISYKVAWPWARAMNANDVCGHVIKGLPLLGQRMRSQGFRYPVVGENVGCGWGFGDAKSVVLATHRAMQAEKRTRGGHWKNIKDTAFKSVGVGVAKGNGRVMVVWDFYGKKY